MYIPALPRRPDDGHKGTFGSVCVIGGQRSEDGVVMVGAPTLTARAAMRSGCGTAILAMPQPVLQSGLILAPTTTGIELPVDEIGRLIPSSAIEALDAHAVGCRALAIGLGFGNNWQQQQMVSTLLSREDRPVVLDADGLNALSQLESPRLDIQAPLILTPHIGEYRRLATAVGIQSESAEALAQAYGCVVVLKNHVTTISDGVRTECYEHGGVELATGGSGDILTGIIVGLLAQFGADCISHLFDAAVLGVYIHGSAGHSWVSEFGNRGMLATDLLERIPAATGTLHR